VKRREGIKLLRVIAYGGQYYRNVPVDATGMENVWNSALKMWSVWSGISLPRTFTDAQKSIASAHIPVYTGGMLSRVLLLGDLVRQGIVVSPTDTEMADLIVKRIAVP